MLAIAFLLQGSQLVRLNGFYILNVRLYKSQPLHLQVWCPEDELCKDFKIILALRRFFSELSLIQKKSS